MDHAASRGEAQVAASVSVWDPARYAVPVGVCALRDRGSEPEQHRMRGARAERGADIVRAISFVQRRAYSAPGHQ